MQLTKKNVEYMVQDQATNTIQKVMIVIKYDGQANVTDLKIHFSHNPNLGLLRAITTTLIADYDIDPIICPKLFFNETRLFDVSTDASTAIRIE